MNRRALCCLLFLWSFGLTAAPDSAPVAGIESVAWLAGHWRGPGAGGEAEEIWAPPRDGAMVGVFRQDGPEGPVFYEILLIREEGESLVLRLKHFHPDLRGWEEKDERLEWPLTLLGEREAVFGPARFHSPDPARLQITVTMRRRDGTRGELKFDLSRVPAAD